jgi:hypothetical protein
MTACYRAWLPVAEGMHRQSVKVELSSEADTFNSKAPAGFKPSEKNKYVLFFYDPAVAPKVHQAFLGLARDCFMLVLPPDPDEDGGKPRHTAVCAYERTPPPPKDMQFDND